MKNADNICLNCDHRLQDELYCPICGQKARIKNLSLRYLLSTFYVAFLDFDKKLLRSLRDIWIPNKISQNFLSGGRRTYVNHMRFFIVCLASCLTLLALHLKRADLSGIEDLQKSGLKAGLKTKFLEFKKTTGGTCDSLVLDSLSSVLFGWESLEEYDDGEENEDVDEDGVVMDTISMDGSKNVITVNRPVDAEEGEISFNNETYNFYDIYNLSPDSIFTKYSIEDPRKQYLLKQGIKTMKNGGTAIGFFISNMLWGILLVTIIMAFVLKLLYLRHKSYFVEHLMHMINYHCVFLISLSVLLLLDLFIEVPGALYFLVILLSGIYLNISLKKYYRQSWIKSIIKAILIFYAYFISFTIAIFLIIGVSFAFL